MNIIHESLIGSRAHGLEHENSDFDFRSIYVAPTKEILSLGYKTKASVTLNGDQDNVAYEIGHFLKLATKANPSVLEVITADSNVLQTYWSKRLMGIFSLLYNPKDAFNAFTGYSHNQKKMFTKNSNSRAKYKYATARIRTLYNLIDLLDHGTFELKLSKDRLPHLLNIRNGDVSDSIIIGLAEELKEQAAFLLPSTPNDQNLDVVNHLLLEIREEFWNK